MRPGDVDDVVRIARSGMLHPWSRRQVWQEVVCSRSMALVACRTGICGYVFFRFIGQEAELLQLVVEPACHGWGIGGRLLRVGSQRLARQGVAVCFLEVRQKNNRARCFYAKFGFEDIGQRVKYYRQPVDDAVVMRKYISGDRSDAYHT